jgi:hypothetical protein
VHTVGYGSHSLMKYLITVLRMVVVRCGCMYR